MFDKIKEPEFEIGDVKFNIAKLDAFSGWQVLEAMRYEMSKNSFKDVALDGTTEKTIQALMALDPVFVNEIRSKVFAKVEFKTKDVERGWFKIDSAEMIAMCFADLEASAIYEVLFRSLAVNFTQSLTEISSRLKPSTVVLNS